MGITLFGAALTLIKVFISSEYQYLFGLPLTALGAYGVYGEARTPLITYIVVEVRNKIYCFDIQSINFSDYLRGNIDGVRSG